MWNTLGKKDENSCNDLQADKSVGLFHGDMVEKKLFPQYILLCKCGEEGALQPF